MHHLAETRKRTHVGLVQPSYICVLPEAVDALDNHHRLHPAKSQGRQLRNIPETNKKSLYKEPFELEQLDHFGYVESCSKYVLVHALIHKICMHNHTKPNSSTVLCLCAYVQERAYVSVLSKPMGMMRKGDIGMLGLKSTSTVLWSSLLLQGL